MAVRTVSSPLIASWILALAGAAGAHGTDKPGPHGGEIRMPGAFHVEAEVVDGDLRLYLLDMQFKNPVVGDSSVEARIEQGGESIALDCSADTEAKAFVCRVPSPVELDQGKLIVEASRDGLPAEPAEYELPLDWPEK